MLANSPEARNESDNGRVGYYRDHAAPGNLGQLNTFRQSVNRLGIRHQAPALRGQRARRRWEALIPLFERWIPYCDRNRRT